MTYYTALNSLRMVLASPTNCYRPQPPILYWNGLECRRLHGMIINDCVLVSHLRERLATRSISRAAAIN